MSFEKYDDAAPAPPTQRAIDLAGLGLDVGRANELQRRVNALEEAERQARSVVERVAQDDYQREKVLRGQGHRLVDFTRTLPAAPELAGLDPTPEERAAVEALQVLHSLSNVAYRAFQEADRLRAVPEHGHGTEAQREAASEASRAAGAARRELAAYLAPLKALQTEREREAMRNGPQTIAGVLRAQGRR